MDATSITTAKGNFDIPSNQYKRPGELRKSSEYDSSVIGNNSFSIIMRVFLSS